MQTHCWGRVSDTVQSLREASMTVGLDLLYRLIAKAIARVHLGRGQATPFVVKRLE